MKDLHRFVAATSELEIFLYGEISRWNLSGRWITDILRGQPDAKTIKIRVNSPGGSVFEGAAIYNALLRHPAKKEVDIDGLAASAASWVVMAGDVRRIGALGMFMIHEAHGDTWGPAVEHEKTAKLLRKMNAQQIDVYAKRAKLSREDIAKKVEDETWFTAAEALKAGFVTHVAEGVSLAQANATEIDAHVADFGFKRAPTAQLSKFLSFAASTPRSEARERLLDELVPADPEHNPAPVIAGLSLSTPTSRALDLR